MKQSRWNKLTNLPSNLMDGLVSIVNPQKAYNRRVYREAYEKLGYRVATPSRLQKMRIGFGGSGDRHLTKLESTQLRELSREQDRNNCIASGMLDRAIESVIGSGIDIHVNSIGTGSDKKTNEDWNTKAELLFAEWGRNEADIRELVSWHGLQQMAYRAILVDGDVGFIKTRGQLQAIEADRIVTPSGNLSNPLFQQGIQLDKVGSPVAFSVAQYSRHGGFVQESSAKSIPAKNFFYLMNPKRFSQTRGVPILTNCLQLLEDIDSYIQAEVVGAKVAAAFVMFISREEGAQAGVDASVTAEDSQGNSRQEQTIAPGMILHGRPGEKAMGIGSNRPQSQFSEFISQLLRFAGLNMGMPLEVVSLDFSRTNFSSARAALQVAHRTNKRMHRFMVDRFVRPVARWKIDQWIEEKRLAPMEYSINTTQPTMISVDPMKEVQSDIMAVEHSFKSLADIALAQNGNWKDSIEKRGREIEFAATEAKRISLATGENVGWRDISGYPKGTTKSENQNESGELENESGEIDG